MKLTVDKEAEQTIKQNAALTLRTKLDTAVRVQDDTKVCEIAKKAIEQYETLINGVTVES